MMQKLVASVSLRFMIVITGEISSSLIIYITLYEYMQVCVNEHAHCVDFILVSCCPSTSDSKI